MNIRNNAKKFLSTALVLSVLSIWSIAQTNQTVAQKAETEIAVTQVKSVQGLTNSQLLSSAGTIIATNNGVTITQGPGTSIPEGPEPQGGWFTPLYAAEGSVKWELLDSEKKVVSSFDSPFLIAIGNKGCWQIDYVTLGTLTTNRVAFDGTNVYSVLISKQYGDQDSTIKTTEHVRVEAPLIVPGAFPVGRSGGIGLLWLAFIAGDYVSQENSARIPNMIYADPSLDPSSWCADFKYDLQLGTSNHLLKKGSFVLNTNYVSLKKWDYPYMNQPENFVDSEFFDKQINRLRQISLPRFDFTTYSLLKQESINKLSIPLSFTCKNFLIPLDGVTTYCNYRLTGNVTNICLSPAAIPLIPVFSNVVLIQDKRFMMKTENEYRNSIFYESTNDWVLSTNSNRLREAGSEVLSPIPPKKHKPNTSVYYIALALFSLLFILPFCKLLRKSKYET